jgi:hypothetical protein
MSSVNSMFEALKFLEWEKSPSVFYKDIFGETPYPYQVKLINDAMKEKRMMVLAAGGLGKTKGIAATALYLAVVWSKMINHPISIIVISGSRDQAGILYGYIRDAVKNSKFLMSLVEGDPLKSITEFKNGSKILRVANSLKAIQGQHLDIVIIDEAVLAGDFIIRDALRITVQSDFDKIFLVGTPMNEEGGLLFVDMWEDEFKYKEWKRFPISARDCPKITIEKYEEAKKSLPDEMFSIFWEGKPFPRTGTLIDHNKLKISTKDNHIFNYEPNEGRVIAGLDWGWCIDSNTELFTDNGWKPLTKINNKDNVLCLDPTNNTSLFLEINNIYSRKYHGRMIQCKHRNLEMCVKPSHVIPVLNRNDTNLHLHHAYENINHDKIIRKAMFDGNIIDYYSIPGFQSNRTDLHLNEPMNINIIPFLKLFGWYITEGNCFPHGIRISQDHIINKNYFDDIIQTVKDCNLHPIIYRDSIIISSERLRIFFSKFGTSRMKYIPKDIKDLHGSLLIHLVDVMIKGDGDKYYPRFNTYSKQLAEDFLEIAFKSGKYHGYIVPHSDGYRVNLSVTNTSKPKWREVEFNGKISTFSVPTELVFTRYNGKISLQHNRDPTALVIIQYSKDRNTRRVLFEGKWSFQDFENELHPKILTLCREYHVERIYADAEDIGENQRLESKGLNITPIGFNQNKVIMQTKLKLVFQQEKIKIPEDYLDLIQQLRIYNWDTAKGEDLVDAMMLALYEEESYGAEYFSKVV